MTAGWSGLLFKPPQTSGTGTRPRSTHQPRSSKACTPSTTSRAAPFLPPRRPPTPSPPLSPPGATPTSLSPPDPQHATCMSITAGASGLGASHQLGADTCPSSVSVELSGQPPLLVWAEDVHVALELEGMEALDVSPTGPRVVLCAPAQTDGENRRPEECDAAVTAAQHRTRVAANLRQPHG